MTRSRYLAAAFVAGTLAAVATLAARAADPAGEPRQSPNLKHYYPVKPVENPPTIETDVCVYGGTSGGVTAAIQAARMGKRAVLVEFGTHVGGLTTGGLSATDGGSAAGGLAKEFYGRVGSLAGFKPAAAERTMLDMLKEAGVPVHFEHRLVGVTKDGGTGSRRSSARTACPFRAKMFVDATYEGDCSPRPAARSTSAARRTGVYKETINGVQPGKMTHQFPQAVDPYVVEGDPTSGLLWGISPTGPGHGRARATR
jgi:hypothetical protein